MRTVLLGLLLAALLGGCGESDSEDTNSEFVRTVDSLCKETRPELVRIQAALVQARDAARSGRASAATTFSTFATLLRQAEATTRRFAARLRAVPVPADERAFRKSVAESVDAGLSNLRRQIGAAQAKDSVTLRELSIAGTSIDSERRGLFAGHGGFSYCGQAATG